MAFSQSANVYICAVSFYHHLSFLNKKQPKIKNKQKKNIQIELNFTMNTKTRDCNVYLSIYII